MKRTILVVDDEGDERSLMASLLERHDYVVESAANGQEAIDRLHSGLPLPDMVLLDLNMPVMDGWQFLALVAADTSLRQLPVIIISGSPTVPDSSATPPNASFMAKPIRPPMILKLMEEMLQHAAIARRANRLSAGAPRLTI
jgi:two-component system, chemotaxis family, sensor histidine kinase and response regulator PixL